MDQNFTHVGFTTDPNIYASDVSCHELQMDSTAFVYHGSLYMISSTKRLYFVNRKGSILLFSLKYSNWYIILLIILTLYVSRS